MHLNDWDGTVRPVTTIPRIVSADDHVVEPPDVFTSRLPAKYRDAGPRVVREPVAEMTFRGGKYAYAMGRRGPARRLVALRRPRHPADAPLRVRGLRARRGAGGADDLRRDAARLLPAAAAPRRHGPQLGRGVAVLPDVPALLRPDVPRGRRQGPRAPVRAGLQRLDGGGVVRGQRRTAGSAVPDPAVGRRARGRRGPAQRGARGEGGVLLRAAVEPRAAVGARRRPLLGPVRRRVRRDRHRHLHAQRLGLEDAVDVARTRRRRCRRRSPTSSPRARWPTGCSRACSCATRT